MIFITKYEILSIAKTSGVCQPSVYKLSYSVYIHAHAWSRDLLWIPLSYKFLWEWWLEIFLIFVKARIVYVCLKTQKVKEYTSFTFHRHCTITNIIQTIIESLLSKSFPSWWVNRETAGVANSIRSIKVCLIDRTLVVHMLMYVCGSYLKGILHSLFIIYASFAISFVY